MAPPPGIGRNGGLIQADEIRWEPDGSRFTMRDLVFVAVQVPQTDERFRPGHNCFHFHKTRPLVDQYLSYFDTRAAGIEGPRLVELGLFDGGSVPFWFEFFSPTRHVGIDIQNKSNPPHLDEYIHRRGLEDRIETHWSTDQADRERLVEICDAAFGGDPIDVVVDDASHRYTQTLASFEALFPRLRPGGLYIIEDWAWFHWRGIEAEWRNEVPLTRLIQELVEATGAGNGHLIQEIDLRSGFAVVQRGPMELGDGAGFRLAEHIYRHPR